MQFSDAGELDSIIGYIRTGGVCKSPISLSYPSHGKSGHTMAATSASSSSSSSAHSANAKNLPANYTQRNQAPQRRTVFHDNKNSTVDRLFNSSPPLHYNPSGMLGGGGKPNNSRDSNNSSRGSKNKVDRGYEKEVKRGAVTTAVPNKTSGMPTTAAAAPPNGRQRHAEAAKGNNAQAAVQQKQKKTTGGVRFADDKFTEGRQNKVKGDGEGRGKSTAKTKNLRLDMSSSSHATMSFAKEAVSPKAELNIQEGQVSCFCSRLWIFCKLCLNFSQSFDPNSSSHHLSYLCHIFIQLSRMLKGAQKAKVAPTLKMTIFLPDRARMKIEVYDVCTVSQVIDATLKAHQAEKRQPPLFKNSEYYELRLHDDDGYAEMDFPALDRSRKIKGFGDGGVHEYCLCAIPGKVPAGKTPGDVGAGFADDMSTMRKLSCVTGKNGLPNSPITFLKVHMNNNDYTILTVKAGMIVKDLIPILSKKQRLPIITDQVVFRLREEDRRRLKMVSSVLNPETPIQSLKIEDIILAKKTFADAPQVAKIDPHAANSNAGMRTSGKRPAQNTFLFNEVTAAMYKQWNVIKTNKWGRRQERLIGIDLTKIYNRKTDGKSDVHRVSPCTCLCSYFL